MNLDSFEICIERNFLPLKRKVQKINGVPKTEDEFKETLTNLLFPGHYDKKPTFREIISHNIRYKDLSINNTLKTLTAYTSDAEYETLHLFLLGCDFEQGDVKQELLTQIKQENTFKKRLEKEQTKSAYETALSILESEIEVLNRRKSNFNLNENFELDLDKLNQVKYQINRLSSEMGKLNIRRNIILEAVNDLNSSVANIDLKQLELIYKQASIQVSGIQKTFEEMVFFHNKMIEEKTKYIAKDIDLEINSKLEHLHRLLKEEADLSLVISRSESFEELEKLITELNEKYRKKGEYENTVKQLSEAELNLETLIHRLDDIDDTLFSHDSEHKIQNQVNKFNKHYSSISQTLYGEQYALKKDPVKNKKGQRLYKFSTFDTDLSSSSSGKKQGEISCFDIAYTLFADEENIPCLHFLLNDKKELMHDNQLLKIAELVNDKDIQFVASILKDKLPDELNKEQYFVLKLSQEDKLFRIEKFNS